MFSLPLAWTLLTVSLWTSGLCQILKNGPLNVLYPKLGQTEAIYCDCVIIPCDSVYWFRIISQDKKVEYIGSYNNADRVYYKDINKSSRFTFNRRGSSSFSLRISNVSQEDTAIYSCVLKDRKNNEMWIPGTLFLPGVTPPTVPPVTKAKKVVKPSCRCKKSSSQDGCDSLILWSLVGLIAGLALAIICTLYYFSRLPKKCRHRFAKTR
ncbi:T-cell surface glycoprotein CD8 beta chain [Scomber scombrus]|uniref:T-cell surface glycoprotein CD8 beta chain n=1 Tax=Scomber scombrus TaxID=13677 RepID=A0AAV1NIW4_SCOSC|nr:uncharacterized protein cd8b [Scomber scombrus]